MNGAIITDSLKIDFRAQIMHGIDDRMKKVLQYLIKNLEVLYMDAYEKAARIDTLDNAFLKELVDYTGYGSRGTLNMVVSLLVTLKDRIQRGDKIKLEKTGDYLTLGSFEKLLEEEFTTYITKAVFKERVLSHKVFFNVENSESGLDLIYSGSNENKLFRWIADIDEEYSLLELIPTSVVYIRNSQTRQLIPFISEKGNHYIYSQKEGKIKEIM